MSVCVRVIELSVLFWSSVIEVSATRLVMSLIDGLVMSLKEGTVMFWS